MEKKMLKKITYQDAAKKWGFQSLDPKEAKRIAAEHGYKIENLHNVVQDAKDDGRF
jgi:hypothetical protein